MGFPPKITPTCPDFFISSTHTVYISLLMPQAACDNMIRMNLPASITLFSLLVSCVLSFGLSRFTSLSLHLFEGFLFFLFVFFFNFFFYLYSVLTSLLSYIHSQEQIFWTVGFLAGQNWFSKLLCCPSLMLQFKECLSFSHAHILTYIYYLFLSFILSLSGH